MPAYIPGVGPSPCNPCDPVNDLELITSSCWRAITNNVGLWSVGDVLTRDAIMIADPESGQVNPSASWFYWNNQATGALVGAFTFDGGTTIGTSPATSDIVTCEAWRDSPRDHRAASWDLTNGASWTPVLAAPFNIVSVAYSVIAGTANIVDAVGNAITAIPTGFSDRWDARISPAFIQADPASRVIVSAVLSD